MKNHTDNSDRLNGDLIKKNNIYYFPAVDSTNLTARRLAEEGAPSFATIIAEEQSKGRGRLGRNWFSPPCGGLWFSLILRPSRLKPDQAPPVTLATAAVLAEHFSKIYALPVKVKWPNDLLINSKKFGGILTELKSYGSHLEYLIVGIGLNINQQKSDFPPEIGRQATSPAIENGRKFNRTTMFLSLREELVNAYRLFFERGYRPFHHLWLKHNFTLGQTLTVKRGNDSISGLAVDLTPEGALVIKDGRGQTHTINCGEIMQSWEAEK